MEDLGPPLFYNTIAIYAILNIAPIITPITEQIKSCFSCSLPRFSSNMHFPVTSRKLAIIDAHSGKNNLKNITNNAEDSKLASPLNPSQSEPLLALIFILENEFLKKSQILVNVLLGIVL